MRPAGTETVDASLGPGIRVGIGLGEQPDHGRAVGEVPGQSATTCRVMATGPPGTHWAVPCRELRSAVPRSPRAKTGAWSCSRPPPFSPVWRFGTAGKRNQDGAPDRNGTRLATRTATAVPPTHPRWRETRTAAWNCSSPPAARSGTAGRPPQSATTGRGGHRWGCSPPALRPAGRRRRAAKTGGCRCWLPAAPRLRSAGNPNLGAARGSRGQRRRSRTLCQECPS